MFHGATASPFIIHSLHYTVDAFSYPDMDFDEKKDEPTKNGVMSSPDKELPPSTTAANAVDMRNRENTTPKPIPAPQTQPEFNRVNKPRNVLPEVQSSPAASQEVLVEPRPAFDRNLKPQPTSTQPTQPSVSRTC